MMNPTALIIQLQNENQKLKYELQKLSETLVREQAKHHASYEGLMQEKGKSDAALRRITVAHQSLQEEYIAERDSNNEYFKKAVRDIRALETNHTAALQKEQDKAQAEKNTLLKTQGKLEFENAQLQKKIQETTSKIETLNKNIEALAAEVSSLKQSNEKTQAKTLSASSDKSKEIEKLKKENQALKDWKVVLEKKNEKSDEELDRLRLENDALRKQMLAKETDKDTKNVIADRTIAALEKGNKRFKEVNEKQSKEIEQLKQELEKLRATIPAASHSKANESVQVIAEEQMNAALQVLDDSDEPREKEKQIESVIPANGVTENVAAAQNHSQESVAENNSSVVTLKDSRKQVEDDENSEKVDQLILMKVFLVYTRKIAAGNKYNVDTLMEDLKEIRNGLGKWTQEERLKLHRASLSVSKMGDIFDTMDKLRSAVISYQALMLRLTETFSNDKSESTYLRVVVLSVAAYFYQYRGHGFGISDFVRLFERDLELITRVMHSGFLKNVMNNTHDGFLNYIDSLVAYGKNEFYTTESDFMRVYNDIYKMTVVFSSHYKSIKETINTDAHHGALIAFRESFKKVKDSSFLSSEFVQVAFKRWVLSTDILVTDWVFINKCIDDAWIPDVSEDEILLKEKLVLSFKNWLLMDSNKNCNTDLSSDEIDQKLTKEINSMCKADREKLKDAASLVKYSVQSVADASSILWKMKLIYNELRFQKDSGAFEGFFLSFVVKMIAEYDARFNRLDGTFYSEVEAYVKLRHDVVMLSGLLGHDFVMSLFLKPEELTISGKIFLISNKFREEQLQSKTPLAMNCLQRMKSLADFYVRNEEVIYNAYLVRQASKSVPAGHWLSFQIEYKRLFGECVFSDAERNAAVSWARKRMKRGVPLDYIAASLNDATADLKELIVDIKGAQNNQLTIPGDSHKTAKQEAVQMPPDWVETVDALVTAYERFQKKDVKAKLILMFMKTYYESFLSSGQDMSLALMRKLHLTEQYSLAKKKDLFIDYEFLTCFFPPRLCEFVDKMACRTGSIEGEIQECLSQLIQYFKTLKVDNVHPMCLTVKELEGDVVVKPILAHLLYKYGKKLPQPTIKSGSHTKTRIEVIDVMISTLKSSSPAPTTNHNGAIHGKKSGKRI